LLKAGKLGMMRGWLSYPDGKDKGGNR